MATPRQIQGWRGMGLVLLMLACSGGVAGLRQSLTIASPVALPSAQPTSNLPIRPGQPDYQALQLLVQRYRCAIPVSGLGTRPLTRTEFAQSLDACLDRMNQLLASGNATRVRSADLNTLQQLQAKFGPELGLLRGRADELEARTVNQNQPKQPSRLPQPSKPGSPPPALYGEATTGIISADAQRANEPNTEVSNTEGYNRIDEHPFRRVANDPLSTFSIDVDTASYSNVRRFIDQGQLPPKDAVRIEELINYFPYSYPQPEGDRPFSVTTEVATAPWNPKHKLVQIGLQGKRLEAEVLPPSNLVFLIDVSGSMDEPNKLPLVKQSLRLLVNELRPQDRVSLVVYAGSAGLVLPPTPGNQKAKILAAIDRLAAGGSTAGGQGIELAYKTARQTLLKSGNNRVILATDGDFNVGISSDAELTRLIEQRRDQGIFLTVLGFGTGNYKDSKMEQLADQGNGNYAYIDTLLEAKKVLVNDLRGTLFTIAKDVKIQVEFNPARVQAYRLIGYENRQLQNQDFNNDKKDAGDIGSGHSVTALYEIIPPGVTVEGASIDPLRYQKPGAIATNPGEGELMQVKLRYKLPQASTSQLITQIVQDVAVDSSQTPSANLRFAAAVATFGMVLRDSEYKGNADLNLVLSLAAAAKGEDREGYRGEFIRLVERVRGLTASR